MNSVVKSIGPIKPTPLAAQIILGGSNLKTQAPTCGIQNDQVALKMFYSQELSKYNDLKIQSCGYFFYIETIHKSLHHLMVLLITNVMEKL